ncbi:7TM diverse intracellular signaling domain-containing protein [Desertivirga arenae]|uniref:7TM diverse intracellular signaling domain-containing protein n=1 Tax=Desertivirga arenae TaxID=2810309 RepID=UPI001A97941E|nr:7TM diverse intracellular signaling domain-containing protein [Pedobacter sp. SYSU D00823]
MRECNVFIKNAIDNIVRLLLSLLLILVSVSVFSQPAVQIRDSVPQHIFSYKEIEQLEDPSTLLKIADVVKFESRFTPSAVYTPKAFNLNSAYWYRIKVKFSPRSEQQWLLEFFDQTIDDITLFEPIGNGKFKISRFGDKYKFSNRQYTHKNFTYNLSNTTSEEKVFYIRVQSTQAASVIVVLRSFKWFSEYATEEYLFFGLFYGMIAVFGFYNLLMFFAVKQKQYLYYVLYNLSIGLYEMCVDGIAFQYLWPNNPILNNYSYGIALYLSSVCGLLFSLNFLYLKSKSPVLYKTVLIVIGLRTLFFVICLFDTRLFTYKLVEILPLIVALYSGITVWKKGYKPARFFVVGYSFLLLGFVTKILVLLNVSWLPYGPVTHYSLSFCFVVEMVLVSFAIGDNIRHLRKRKDKAQKRMIYQLQVNEKLKDTLNSELTTLVDQRTREVVEKAKIIEQKNEELSAVNVLLQQQAEEISRMNLLLEKDNQELTVSIEKVTRARVMSQEVDFEEFSKIYPDRETCFKYLSDLKWTKGYSCRKCGNTNFHEGQLPYSRRCTKCRYEESVIANTIFQNSRIPINKAFYMLFLVYSTKGKISSHKLSEILSIRQSTCWAYGSKMKKVMDERKRELKNAGEKGWSKLVLEVVE